MDILKKLELKRLLKFIEFLKSDFDYKIELMKSINMTFFNEVNKYLEKNSKLKDIYNDFINEKTDNILNLKKQSEYESIYEQIFKSDNIKTDNDKLKKLYRSIVKQTHPDVSSNNEKYESLYIEATSCFNNNDLMGLILICDKLNIDFELDDKDILFLKDEIKFIKNKIKFIKKSISWKWFHCKEEKTKKKLIFLYIKNTLK